MSLPLRIESSSWLSRSITSLMPSIMYRYSRVMSMIMFACRSDGAPMPMTIFGMCASAAAQKVAMLTVLPSRRGAVTKISFRTVWMFMMFMM